MRRSLLLCLGLCLPTSAAWADSPAAVYRYDARTGTCRDAKGEQGRNTTTLEALKASGKGQCVDFAKSGIASLNDGGNFVTFEGWDLRGADLSDVTLTYTLLQKADLRGANLSKMRFFYYCLAGRTDRYTRLPEGLRPRKGRLSAGDSCP